MATYNWAYNPIFTPNGYVSPTGSDQFGDGTANKPYRTRQKCIDTSKLLIQCAPEVIRDNITVGSGAIFYESGCIVDGFSLATQNFFSIYGGKFVNTKMQLSDAMTIKGCNIKGTISAINTTSVAREFNIIECPSIASNVYHGLSGTINGRYANTTFVNSTFNFGLNSQHIYPNGANRCIFYNCDIILTTNISANPLPYDFNLYYNCRYKFGNDTVFLTQAQLESTYGALGIEAVKAYYNSEFGSNDVFAYSRVADPLFNNPEYGDYTLQPMSPARHMAYDGTFIGAKDVGFPTLAYANDLGYPNAFYNASKTANVLVANNNITLTRNPDGSAVGSGQITEKPKDLGKIYELKTNSASYVFADRNREMLDFNSDIDMSLPISAGTALTSGIVYINEGGSVVYNSITYSNRSRILAVDSVQSFTTSEGAVLYAVNEYPNRYTNKIRHKQTIVGTQIAAGTDVLTADSWYRVYTNSITWDSKTVPVGDIFHAVAGKLSFTGTGVCVEEFNSSDVWHEVVIDAPIKCRRVGNVATGAIDVGSDGKPLTNGHKEYYNATNKGRTEFPIFARYIQKDWYINAKMSK